MSMGLTPTVVAESRYVYHQFVPNYSRHISLYTWDLNNYMDSRQNMPTYRL